MEGEAEDTMEQDQSAPLKRRSKRKKNLAADAQVSRQTSKLAAERKEGSDSSDSESTLCGTQIPARCLSHRRFITFLQKNKSLRATKAKCYFHNLRLFYCSPEYHIGNKEKSGFTDQHVDRLRKITYKKLHQHFNIMYSLLVCCY